MVLKPLGFSGFSGSAAPSFVGTVVPRVVSVAVELGRLPLLGWPPAELVGSQARKSPARRR